MDHIVKPAAFAALCIHWFNPLVWIAFILSCKDMEMSCDEAVIKRFGEDIRADHSASLLALSAPRRVLGGIPVDFGEGDTKGRVRNLAAFRKTKKGVLAVLIAGVAVLIVCLASNRTAAVPDGDNPETEIAVIESQKMPVEPEPEISDHRISEPDAPEPDRPEPSKPDEPEAPTPMNISLDITERYVTHKGDPSNLFYIDGDNVLWGSGRNDCGQLGQGTQDYEFHAEMVKIAEGAVHVDYSQNGFVIFLTEDHKLYGMGNAGCGALQQYEEFDWGEIYKRRPLYSDRTNPSYGRCGLCMLRQRGHRNFVWIKSAPRENKSPYPVE